MKHFFAIDQNRGLWIATSVARQVHMV
jgi:hypothetical protein